MSGSFTQDMNRWKQGDASAQFDLERRLQPFLLQLIRFARQRLDTRLRARIDSEGVVYAALKSFLTGIKKEEFPALENREQVQALLTSLVNRTLCDEIRWHERDKRSPKHEEPGGDGHLQDVPAAGALVTDLTGWLEKLEAVVRPVHEKAIDIIELSLRGFSNIEIARKVGLGVRRVQLLKQQMREHWESAARAD